MSWVLFGALSFACGWFFCALMSAAKRGDESLDRMREEERSTRLRDVSRNQ